MNLEQRRMREVPEFTIVTQCTPPDPIFLASDGWRFWDETWSDAMGPWKTEQEAREKLDQYCKEELGYA